MKYIKPILVIAITASVAGFVVWHLMWMTGIEKKIRAEYPSGFVNKIEVKEVKSKDQKLKTKENRPVGGKAAMSVKESGTQTSQAGAALQETEKQRGSKADSGARLPVEETKPEAVKEDAKWFEKDIRLGKKQQGEIPVTGETRTEVPNNKNTPVTVQNKANPVMQKNIPLPQPMQRPEVKITGMTHHPTSTAP